MNDFINSKIDTYKDLIVQGVVDIEWVKKELLKDEKEKIYEKRKKIIKKLLTKNE